MILHPSESRLNRFADGELSRRLRIRTAAHLEGCSRCRNTIVAIRRLSREARVMPQPSAPAGLKDRILERLANGERVILPVADPPMPVRTGRRVAAAFAATAAAAMLFTIVRAPDLASEASDLNWFPEQPQMGAQLDFEYRATTMFA
ncbi:MAG: zf-HC2 domain-containing protein, partial [Gemmatimonadetes bacterium]|nr:zf-HC2 domain-containing protein [Gemmatimonadota bacterium]